MSDPKDDKTSPTPQNNVIAPVVGHGDDRMEDEEKILAGRHDVNYPAMLTRDVPGG